MLSCVVLSTLIIALGACIQSRNNAGHVFVFFSCNNKLDQKEHNLYFSILEDRERDSVCTEQCCYLDVGCELLFAKTRKAL